MVSTTETVLSVDGLTVGYGESDVLTDVGVEANRGEIISVIGPNGAGKSTLLKAIFGFLSPKSGKILLQE